MEGSVMTLKWVNELIMFVGKNAFKRSLFKL